MPLPTPPKKAHLPLGLGGGVAGFDLAQKGRAGDDINMRWTMTTMTMASISEHKGILTSNIIFSFTIYHTNK